MRAKRVAIFGAGRSGLAAKKLLESEGREVVLLEGDAPPPDWREVDFAVASPGVPLTHEWFRSARAAGVKVISELQLGASRWKGPIVAVTGSKGKSSVVKLVADALGGIPCGNYGTPLCEVAVSSASFFSRRDAEFVEPQSEKKGAPNGALPWAVVEVSSFQMETTDDFHPLAAACLNLQEDHLDRHGSVEAYHALKKKLLAMAGRVITPSAEFDPLLAGSYFDNRILRENGEIAAGFMRFAGLSDEEIAAAFVRFVPLPHRMQEIEVNDPILQDSQNPGKNEQNRNASHSVDSIHDSVNPVKSGNRGVRFIDDSKATSLAALAAGVEMAKSRLGSAENGIFLIAGGLGKGDSPEICIPCLQNGVKKVYTIGATQQKLFEAWRGIVPCEIAGTLECAVAAAKSEARAGDIVLLSPGAASFDQFTSYGARGDAFAAFARGAQKR